MNLLPRMMVLTVSMVLMSSAAALADEPTITAAELTKRTQALYDAIPAGDRTLWRKYFAEDCIYHDEKGRGFDKAQLLADLSPMPQGYAGTIKLLHPQTLFTTDCAIFSYDLDESETIFGQALQARYHTIDTWLYRHGEWQIAASQTMRYYEDPALGQSDPARYAAYVGSYELARESERRTTVTVADGKLFMQKSKGKTVELFPEATDLFFRRGEEGRILFHFAADGKVDMLIDRRNNEDVVWRKIG